MEGVVLDGRGEQGQLAVCFPGVGLEGLEGVYVSSDYAEAYY